MSRDKATGRFAPRQTEQEQQVEYFVDLLRSAVARCDELDDDFLRLIIRVACDRDLPLVITTVEGFINDLEELFGLPRSDEPIFDLPSRPAADEPRGESITFRDPDGTVTRIDNMADLKAFCDARDLPLPAGVPFEELVEQLKEAQR
jgi:hypothetical protein